MRPRQVDGDRGLLEDAATADPDRFRKRARQWAGANSPDRGEEQLKRQRARRKAYAFWDHARQMGVVHAELDPIRFGQVRQALDLRAEALRRADGGGEVPPDDVRTGEQRRADALFELLTGRDADHLRPIEGMGGKASTRLVIIAELGLIDGSDPDGKCEILDTGPVPPSILRWLSPDTQITGAIFDRSGNPLWLGRSRRLANASQRLVAAIRDRGCVLPCDALTHQTQQHHVVDWYAGGPTDIDNLAFAVRLPPPTVAGTQPGVGRSRQGVANSPRLRTPRSVPSRRPAPTPRPRRSRPLTAPSPFCHTP